MLDDSQTAEFVQLLTGRQLDLYLYIRALVFDGDCAADILAEANVTIWEERDKFKIGANFRAWACGIARHKVLQWRAHQRRERVLFSDDVFQELVEQADRQAEPPNQRLEDLRHCMGKLPPEDRELIMRRYGPGASAEQIAAEAERPTEWVYKAVYRIRKALTLCVFKQMALRHHEEACQ